jgi:hypothetical protein
VLRCIFLEYGFPFFAWASAKTALVRPVGIRVGGREEKTQMCCTILVLCVYWQKGLFSSIKAKMISITFACLGDLSVPHERSNFEAGDPYVENLFHLQSVTLIISF